MIHDASGGSLQHSGRLVTGVARLTRLLGLVLAAGSAVCAPVQASEAFLQDMRTDANVITAIDVSDSIGRHEEWLQQTGLVRALLDPRFVDAATGGLHRRIGFAVFTWSSDGRFDALVPWTIIGSAEQAAQVSAAIASVEIIDRSGYGGGDVEDARGENEVITPERRTDISGAIDHASLLLASAPFETSRSVMNICADGVDNAGIGSQDGVRESRDRAVANGLIVNGVAMGDQQGLRQYFRSNVIGGHGSFVLKLSSPSEAGKIMAEKFRRDLLAGTAVVEPQMSR